MLYIVFTGSFAGILKSVHTTLDVALCISAEGCQGPASPPTATHLAYCSPEGHLLVKFLIILCTYFIFPIFRGNAYLENDLFSSRYCPVNVPSIK